LVCRFKARKKKQTTSPASVVGLLESFCSLPRLENFFHAGKKFCNIRDCCQPERRTMSFLSNQHTDCQRQIGEEKDQLNEE
jgi:hypothetical protein